MKSIEQLRAVCSHVGALVVPNATSIANVQQAFAPDGRTALVRRLAQEAERFLANLARRNPGATPAERRELLASELARSSTLRRLTAADPEWNQEAFLDRALATR